MDKCKLCGKEHKSDNYGSTYRYAYIDVNGYPISQFGLGYAPWLDIDEISKLKGTKDVYLCTDRKGCRKRQLAL